MPSNNRNNSWDAFRADARPIVRALFIVVIAIVLWHLL